jgi:hypothetical protein
LLRSLEETIVECPSGSEPGALGVKISVAEQSCYEDCPVSGRAIQSFVGSRPGEILSICVSAD